MSQTETGSNKALVYQTQDGRVLISTYATGKDAERISAEMDLQGATSIGAMTVKEARELEERKSKSSQIPDWDHLRR